MPNTTLKEYYWNGNAFVSGGQLVLDPNPRMVTKSIKGYWRVRPRREEAKARYRGREEMDWTFEGICSDDKRNEIEYYAKRHSKFHLTYSGMDTKEDNCTRTGCSGNYASASYIDTVVVIEEVTFKGVEGQIKVLGTNGTTKGTFTYTLKVSRVSDAGIEW